MAKLTITRAKKILGELADNVPDEQIEQDIRTAELLKNLFFRSYTTRVELKKLNFGNKRHG